MDAGAADRPDGGVDARATDAGRVDAGPAPTFAQLYRDYFGKVASATVIGCKGMGGACHEVNHEGFICSTAQNCYDSISIRADAEALENELSCRTDPKTCIISSYLVAGTMPKGSRMKKFAAADLEKLYAWIRAGAKNN